LPFPRPPLFILPLHHSRSPLCFSGNLQLSITNVHVRYEDTVTHPGHPFAVGITLEGLKGHTVDAEGREAFVTSNPMDVLRKALKLQRAAVYFDCGQGQGLPSEDDTERKSVAGKDAVLWVPLKAWQDMAPVEWEDWFQPGVSALRQERGGTAKDRQYVLRPVDGRAFYTRRGAKAARGDGEAVAEAEFQLDVIAIGLSRKPFFLSFFLSYFLGFLSYFLTVLVFWLSSILWFGILIREISGVVAVELIEWLSRVLCTAVRNGCRRSTVFLMLFFSTPQTSSTRAPSCYYPSSPPTQQDCHFMGTDPRAGLHLVQLPGPGGNLPSERQPSKRPHAY
jgi:hypothetical protein